MHSLSEESSEIKAAEKHLEKNSHLRESGGIDWKTSNELQNLHIWGGFFAALYQSRPIQCHSWTKPSGRFCLLACGSKTVLVAEPLGNEGLDDHMVVLIEYILGLHKVLYKMHQSPQPFRSIDVFHWISKGKGCCGDNSSVLAYFYFLNFVIIFTFEFLIVIVMMWLHKWFGLHTLVEYKFSFEYSFTSEDPESSYD